MTPVNEASVTMPDRQLPALPGAADAQLLRPHPEPQPAVPGRRPGARQDHAAAVHVEQQVLARGAGDGGGEQVGLAEEVGGERRARQLVQLGGRAELLDPSAVHDRDGVGHRHGLLLVVRDVHEREADLGLDALELHLHLPAQLEVEGAERLVEQQHRRPVDDGAGQRDALLLAAGQLRRLAVRERAAARTSSRTSSTCCLTCRRAPRGAARTRRCPNTSRCGNSA